MKREATVFIVDDDAAMRQSLVALVDSFGMRAEAFDSAESFLSANRAGDPGCVVTDFRMPGRSGMELQRELLERGWDWPVIMLTAYAEVPMTVQAMRDGAVIVLEKPARPEQIESALREAIELDAKRRVTRVRTDEMRQRLGELSDGEREVLTMLLEGKPNKTIARTLDIGLRTVEARRARIFQKLNAKSLAELVRTVCEVEPQMAQPTGA